MNIVRLVICVVVLLPAASVLAEDLSLSRPTSIVAVESDWSVVLVSNLETGVISRIDLNDGHVIREFPVGRGLSHLVQWPGTDLLLAVDHKGNSLHVVRWQASAATIVQTIPLAAAPLRVAVSSTGAYACLTFAWADTAQVLKLDASEPDAPVVTLLPPINIGFPQQEVIALTAGEFLLADRFRGRLAVIDAATPTVTLTASIHGHNIRGLLKAVDGQCVLVAHQILSRVARTSLEDVHWGMVMQNVIRRISVSELLMSDPKQDIRGTLYQLGDTGDGFADPGAMTATNDGFIVLSGGTQQLMFVSTDGKVRSKIATGFRPVAVQKVEAGVYAIVNAYSDSVTIVEGTPDTEFVQRVSGLTNSGAADVTSGEVAFFDGRLSHDGWMSCHSCHTDGHSPDLLADTLGDGSYGDAKRIPSLLGTAETSPWGWTGKQPTLADQIKQTLTSTMHSKVVRDDTIADLTVYLNSLRLPAKATPGHDNDEAIAGERLFEHLGCIRCHAQPNYTTPETYDVGLIDAAGRTQFNPPSLRGVAGRHCFLHDGQAHSIEEVLKVHPHNHKPSLDDAQVKTLAAYLKTL